MMTCRHKGLKVLCRATSGSSEENLPRWAEFTVSRSVVQLCLKKKRKKEALVGFKTKTETLAAFSTIFCNIYLSISYIYFIQSELINANTA